MKSILLLFLFSLTSVSLAQRADAVLGEWSTPENKSKVSIYKCDSGYCGKIVWLKEPEYQTGHARAGQQKVDDKNPMSSERKRPILGLEIMRGFSFDEDDVWENGKIYDPENGKTYSCKMTLNDKNTLSVRGFIGFSLFGRTSIWTR